MYLVYQGLFEILQLTGSFTMAEEGRRRTGGLSVSLAHPDGRVFGGVVAGMLRAGTPIQVYLTEQPQLSDYSTTLSLKKNRSRRNRKH